MALWEKKPTKTTVPWFTKLYLIASRQLPQSCEANPKRMAGLIKKVPQSSDTNTLKSARFSYPLGSSLQESQSLLLSSLHHVTLHFSRDQINQLNDSHLPFVPLKQGSVQ